PAPPRRARARGAPSPGGGPPGPPPPVSLLADETPCRMGGVPTRPATPASLASSRNIRARVPGARGLHHVPAEHVIDEARERAGRGCDVAARAAVHQAHDLGPSIDERGARVAGPAVDAGVEGVRQ